MTNRSIREIKNNESLAYAKYTIENRAIPSLIDGLKPVQRYFLFSTILNASKEFKKVAGVGGVVSEYGYNHTEVACCDAGQLMVASWNTNINLIDGSGSFGSRAIKTPASHRYTKVKLSDNFNKYFKDIDLSPKHPDDDHLPPKYYLPIIPFILVNGSSGIATAYKQDILPYSIESIIACTREYLMTGNITNELVVKIPDFNGIVNFLGINEDTGDWKFEIVGKYHIDETKKRYNEIYIDEIPPSFDRIKYGKHLQKLVANGEIADYDELTAFKYVVRVAKTLSTDYDDVLKLLKLKEMYTQHLMAIDQNGDLKSYSDARDMIKDFVDYRFPYYGIRVKNEIIDLERQYEIAYAKALFTNNISQYNFSVMTKNQLIDCIKNGIDDTITSITKDDTIVDILLNMKIYSMTQDQSKKLYDESQSLARQIRDKKKILDNLKGLYDSELSKL